MIKKCLVCGNLFDTTETGRYKYCSKNCAKSRNNDNYPRDLSTLRFNEPAQVELEGDGYADGNLFMTMVNVLNVVGTSNMVIKIGKNLIVAIVDND